MSNYVHGRGRGQDEDDRRRIDRRRINNSLNAALLQKGSLYFETLKRRLIGRLVERTVRKGERRRNMTDRERVEWTFQSVR